ncbi:MAG: glycosyl hydrolase family 8 [Myxococcota bacterium]|nr:glycosyl hydrolase family 8 [Myxococcota bacterium]
MTRLSAARCNPALLRGSVLVFLAVACGSTVDTVGYNASEIAGGTGGADVEAGASGDSAGAGEAGAGGVTPEGGVGGLATGGAAGSGGLVGTGGLKPLTGPDTYPNVFRDVLGKTDREISTKISKTFDQLFHGDPASEAVYYELDDDTAYIRDTLHDDVRTEGIGHGMIITVELDKREEFDKLWRYADGTLKVTTGPNAGYFRSRCQTLAEAEDCYDPYGLQQMLMALIFAHGRWGSSTGSVNYELEALEVLDLIRNKELMNGGIVDGVTDTFDAETKLVFDFPNTSTASYTRPSVEMPAFYELWAQATGDAFYAEAAAAARSYWKRAEHPETGFLPWRAYFDGKPVEDWETFEPEGYRASYNIALDRIWFGSDAWHVEHSDRMIAFFDAVGINTYGRVYTLDGTLVQGDREPSLVAANGPVAMLSTLPASAAFIEAVWNLPIPTYDPRYYNGTMQLLALIVMAGQYRVY